MQNKNHELIAWDNEQKAIAETLRVNKAAASWEADNEEIKKMQNKNHELIAWDDEQRAIKETIARNKATASWEADNEEIRKMMNDNYAKSHPSTSSGSSSKSSGGSYYGSNIFYSSVSIASAGGIDTGSLNTIIEHHKAIMRILLTTKYFQLL